MSGTASALIMEGGAMRGMFTCGVIDVMMKHGFTFKAAAGISAGAVFGCNYKSGQIGRALRYNLNYARSWRYCSLRSLILTGDLYGADFCYRKLPDLLDPFDREAFRNNPMRFFVGATDVATGACVYHECTDGGERDMQWLRASASMPVVSRPVHVDGAYLLDGGIADAVPFAHMERLGYTKQVILLTQPKGYRKQPVFAPGLLKWALRRTPDVAGAMMFRHEMYNRQMDEIDAREKSGVAIVLRPPEPLNIGRTENNPKELKRVYEIGCREAEKYLEVIGRFIGA